MNKVIIEQFFNLSEAEQWDLTNQYQKRQRILHRIKSYREEQDLLNKELEDIRLECQHPLMKIEKIWDKDEYGKLLESGWTKYKCPDCGYSNTENF